jgi:nucleoside transporter
LLTAAVSAALGLFSFTLPETPPAGAGSKITLSDILGLEALSLLKSRNFFVFFLSCVLICIPLAFYYQETNVFLNDIGMKAAAAKMSMGQMSELAFMLLMPLFFKRLGVKWMLMVAMAAWVLRYLLFGWGNTEAGIWMLYAGIILHGICYDFFFVTGQIYTDKKAGKRIRSAAQGMITLATYGVGMLVGFWIAGKVADYYTLPDGQHAWQKIWLVPAAIAAAVGLLFAVFFRNERSAEPSE